jgi:hypothetical protein
MGIRVKGRAEVRLPFGNIREKKKGGIKAYFARNGVCPLIRSNDKTHGYKDNQEGETRPTPIEGLERGEWLA